MATCSTCGRDNRADAAYCDGCGAPLGGTTPAAPSSVGGAGQDREPFVGRERELAALGSALEQVIEGRGHIALLSGEPGIGKTRTAQTLARHAEGLGVQVLWGRCREQLGAPPYWPWLQLLRAFLEDRTDPGLLASLGAAASDLAELVPDLAQRLPSLPEAARSADPAQARFRLFDGIARFWKRAAAETPLLLIFDNLHWADIPSLRLLEFFAPDIADSRLFVVSTYRDIELSRSHPLSNTLGELARHPRLHRLRLAGLSESETTRIVSAASGEIPTAELAARIQAQTEGNPLFVTEMTRFLVEEGVLGPAGAANRSTTARPVAEQRRIPEGIKEAIGTRLNRLSQTCNTVLAGAAVIGRVFSLDVLEQLFDDLVAEQVGAAIEEALTASVIEELEAGGQFQFSHALIRETLYEEIPPIRRMGLHLRIAVALEQLHRADLTSQLSALAHHYGAALPGGNADKALEYARLAAERADAQFAYEETVRHCQLGLQALQAAGDSEQVSRCRLQIMLGEAQVKAGENLQGAQVLQQAAADARTLGVTHDLARAAVAFEEATWRPGMPGDAAVRLLRDALEALGDEESPLTVQVLSSLTRALIFSGALDEAKQPHERALAMARRIGDPSAVAAALRSAISARWLPGEFPQQTEATLEVMRLAKQIGDKERFFEAASWRLFDLMELGDKKARDAFFAMYARLGHELRQPFYEYVATSFRAMRALLEGDFDESERWAQQALELGQRMPSLDAAGIYGMQIFCVRREQGRLAGVEPLVSHFVQNTPESARWRPGLAVIYCELGLDDRARAELEVLAENDFADVLRDGSWLTCTAFLSEVCSHLGDAARAATLYEALLPCDGRNLVAPPNIACFGAASRYLGMLASTMGRYADAERHFEQALEMNARQEALPWLAHTQLHYATMLIARHEPGDRDRAAALLDAALATARSFGMQTVVNRADALRAQTGEPSKPRYPAGLSPREVEVLRLVAAGKGNREIAGCLFISANTVANHVRSILTKTESANRTEAAAFAFQHGLVTD